MTSFKTVLIIVFLLLMHACSNQQSDFQNESELSGKSDLSRKGIGLNENFILDKVIGGEYSDLTDDYILVSPNNICINQNGDLLVPDEIKIKVFDNNGKPKTIFGGKGQGPGEFSGTPLINVGPSGFITAFEFGGMYAYLTLFSPDFKFIYKKRLMNFNLLDSYLESEGFSLDKLQFVRNFSPIDEFELICDMWFKEEEKMIVYFVHIKPHEISPITKIETMSSSSGINTDCFFYCLVDNKNVAYWKYIEDTQYMKQSYDKEKGAYYTLNLYNLETKTLKKYLKEYVPGFKTDKEIEEQVNRAAGTLKWSKGKIKESINRQKQLRYYPAIRELYVDGNYIYLYNINLQEEVINVDIFDLKSDNFLPSIILTEAVYPLIIKDGKGYSNSVDENGFSQINIFNINPKIYEQPVTKK